MDTSIAPGSDDSAYGQSLGASCPRPLFNGDFCERGGGGGDLVFMEAMAGGMPEMADAQDDGAVAERGQETAAPPSDDAAGGGTTAVRTFFPETWIWTDIALTGGAGVASATMPVTAPDTITTWSLEAFTTSPDGISAVRSRMPLRVFKPFFVEMRLPYASVRGEDVELIIAVFNYAEGTGTLDAQLQVTLPAEVELVNGEASLQLSVPEAGAARHALRLRPKALGSFQLEASAVSGAYSDAMRKPLLVKPEGVPQHETKSVVIDLTSSSTADALLELTLPAAAVNDSARLQVTAVGDLLGPTISGLERLLQIPTGCGEQNMITLAPNVYVAKYLLATSKLTPELRQRVVNNMVVGYGRQLTYRHDDGSFSAFGKPVHGTGLVAVDTSVLAKAAAFLVNLQQADGSFRSVGKVIHQASVEVPNLAVPGLADALTSAASYLSSASSPSQYAVLLRAQALGLAGQWTSDRVASEVLDISSMADGKRFWASAGEGKSAAKDIEMTGYGLLALTSAGRLTEAFQAARWLLERRSDTGGFSSTQDTVVALNALASYATAAGQNVDVTLQVGHGGSNQESFQINAANMDVLQSFAPSVAVGANQISVSASGSGTALVTASLRYNMPDTVVLPCYDVEVNWYSSAVQAVPSGAVGRPFQILTFGIDMFPVLLARAYLKFLEPANGEDKRWQCMQCLGGKEKLAVGWCCVFEINPVGLFTGYAASVKSLQSLKDEKVVKRWDLGDGTVDLYMEDSETRREPGV
ncbi:CD109 [Symbiodinium sp. CCMP2592]|nr:CD109 [Symbiodinium sp. CCMP2592]